MYLKVKIILIFYNNSGTAQ